MLDFFKRMASESDGTPSSKRFISLYAVSLYSIIMVLAFVLSLNISEPVMHMADMLLGSALGSYVIGRFSEGKSDVRIDSTPQAQANAAQIPLYQPGMTGSYYPPNNNTSQFGFTPNTTVTQVSQSNTQPLGNTIKKTPTFQSG
jgi:hypothetical protein